MSPSTGKKRLDQGKMNVLLSPAIAVMNRLKYPQKFALISLLFVLPLALVMYLLISEINERIDFSQKEIHGTMYLRPLRKLLEHVPQERMLADSYLSGRVSLRPELERKEAEVDEDFVALEAVDQKLGKILQTTEKFSALKDNWKDLKEKTLRLETTAIGASYTKLMADIRDLISHVGDTSNLIAEPDPDSYYLMDAVLLKLPEGEDLLAHIRSLGEDIVTRKTLTAGAKAQLLVLAGLLKANSDATKKGMSIAFSNNPAGNLKLVLERPLEESIIAIEELLDMLYTEIIYAETLNIQPTTYVESVTKTLDASFNLWDRTIIELDGLLKARIDKLSQKKHLVEIFALLVLMVVIYLLVAFYLAVMRTVASLEEASQRMVSGNMDGVVTLETQDELGQVAKSFNHIATRLQTEWAQAREESARQGGRGDAAGSRGEIPEHL